jgi:iron complex transport system substrate-binding protein
MMGNNFNGTWFMPGGQNYMCRYLEDAGFDYPLLETKQRGSLAMNFENVLDKFRTSDVWLGVSAKSLNKLVGEDSRYALFDPFIKEKVYSVNGRVNSQMGNDYWESGVVYPDRILADLVRIAHPSLLPDHHVSYYKKITR